MKISKSVAADFLVPVFVFLFYLFGLAPTVTLEDSGELITAAYSWGIPHPPGYPLYTIMLGLFLRLFSFAEPAFVANLFSALLFSLASFIYLRIMKLVFGSQNLILQSLLTVFIFGLAHVYRQAVITEVYGLHAILFLWALYLILSANKDCSQQRYALISFLLGLALANHHLSLVLIPVFFWVCGVNFRFAFILLGLMFYFYLPLASLANPFLDWGNPENMTNFLFHVGRKQYQPFLQTDLSLINEQMREQVLLLLRNLSPVGIFLGVLGLSECFKTDKKNVFVIVLLLILTGPITAYLTNFNIPLSVDLYYQDINALLSVFYIPHYFIWGILIFYSLNALSKQIPKVIFVLSLSFLVGLSLLQTYQSESQKKNFLAREMLQNWQNITKNENAFIFVNFDPLSFPPMYFQEVLGEAKNLKIVDVELLKGAWYRKAMLARFPELFSEFEAQFVNEQTFRQNYDYLLNSIFIKAANLSPSFFAVSREFRSFNLTIIKDLNLEPLPGLTRIFVGTEASGFSFGDDLFEKFNYASFNRPQVKEDRVSLLMMRFYVGLLLDIYERDPMKVKSIELAEKIAKHDTKLLDYIRSKKGHSL
jgi:hypothetical protein